MDPGTSERERRPSSHTLTATFPTGPINSFPPQRVTGLRWRLRLPRAKRRVPIAAAGSRNGAGEVDPDLKDSLKNEVVVLKEPELSALEIRH
jgi:hypothetical protein